MSDLETRIQERLDKLEKLMKENKHIGHAEAAMDYTTDITKFWSVLSEEDRDFLQGVQHAIEEQIRWE
jgi:hypothetical protein